MWVGWGLHNSLLVRYCLVATKPLTIWQLPGNNRMSNRGAARSLLTCIIGSFYLFTSTGCYDSWRYCVHRNSCMRFFLELLVSVEKCYKRIMINDSGPVTSCISSFIFSVRNTTLSTTRVIFPYTAEIQNVLVYAYKIYRAIHCFSDIFGVVYEADQSTTPTKFYNEYTTPVIFPIYS